MENFLVPLSFTNRRAPLVQKVKDDADRMARHARYLIILDDQGGVLEIHHNSSKDGSVVDCLVVLAPLEYRGTYLHQTVVLEIGFRRFVPYAQTEFFSGPPKKRTPGGRRPKNPAFKRREKRPGRPTAIKPRIPVATLSDDAMFDLMPTITEGIQACVDELAQNWTGTLGKSVKWVPSGNEARMFWNKLEIEPEIHCRLPEEARLLCATATFAEMQWRKEPQGAIAASARAIKNMLEFLIRPGKVRHRDKKGNFSDDFVRESNICHWVAERFKVKLIRSYTAEKVEALFDCIGPKGSVERKLVEQIWRVHKVQKPKQNKVLKRYEATYGYMKEALLERWGLRNYASVRRLKKKAAWLQERTSTRPYRPHATNSLAFSVFVSQEAQQQMDEAYCARRAQEANSSNVVQPIRVQPKIPFIPAPQTGEDDDIPFERTPNPIKRTGTDDDIPF